MPTTRPIPIKLIRFACRAIHIIALSGTVAPIFAMLALGWEPPVRNFAFRVESGPTASRQRMSFVRPRRVGRTKLTDDILRLNAHNLFDQYGHRSISEIPLLVSLGAHSTIELDSECSPDWLGLVPASYVPSSGVQLLAGLSQTLDRSTIFDMNSLPPEDMALIKTTVLKVCEPLTAEMLLGSKASAFEG